MHNADPVLLAQDSRGVATLTLNRPERRNAFDDTLIGRLHGAITQLANDRSVRIVVLTGAGTAFCAGMDLDHMRRQGTQSEVENKTDALLLARCLQTLDRLDKPVIARVNGGAYGGGLGLIACADIAIGTSTAKFALTEVRLGIVPAVISPYILRAIGEREARRWFLSGAAFSANKAEQIGLLHEVREPTALDAAVEDEIASLLKGGPKAQGEAKALAQEVARMGSITDESAVEYTAELLARLRASSEGQEGLAAFNERRTPSWCGK
ncbi:MAG: enoyl-CoA hydratase/isomerase family protein [Candidatus Obscuribacterales bacterium]|nr:enoyl-CoA hydratase/isomerase family protein [Steroidobacteraceae bacterium]